VSVTSAVDEPTSVGPRRIYLALGFMQGVSLGMFALAAVAWWVVDLDLSPFRLILLGIALEAVVLIAESPTGVVADVFSRKWSIVLAWVVMGISQVLSPVSESLWILLIWQGLFGLGYTFQSGADTAWVTDEIGAEDDGLVMNKAIALMLGIVVGVGAAIALTQWSIRGTMAVSGLISVAFAAVLAVVMTERNFTPVDRTKQSAAAAFRETWHGGFVVVWRSRVLRILMLSTFVVAMVDESVDRLDFPRMRELGFPDLGADDSAAIFGAVWIVMTLLALPVMLVASRRADEFGSDRRSAALMAVLLMAGAFGIGLMAGSVFVVAVGGWILRDVTREVVEPLGEGWANRRAPSAVRATVISFRSQSMAFGEVVGGLLLGLLAELASLQIAFAAGAVLMAMAGIQIAQLAFDRQDE
jgi:DHA3 family tetracycline resistance protein-like MFS transporter